MRLNFNLKEEYGQKLKELVKHENKKYTSFFREWIDKAYNEIILETETELDFYKKKWMEMTVDMKEIKEAIELLKIVNDEGEKDLKRNIKEEEKKTYNLKQKTLEELT